MICIGFDTTAKLNTVADYCAENGVRKVFALSPQRFRVEFSGPNVEHVEWSQIIQYKYFYRLLQEIDDDTLIVVNECLRTQNRNDLTYNCIRNFLNQTSQQIVFQHLPVIDTIDDFMVLFDFDTRSRWKRHPFDPQLVREARIEVHRRPIRISATRVSASPKDHDAYALKKRELIENIGLRDPHTIPRNLLLLAGKCKLEHVDPRRWYVGRNNRFKLERMATYREVADRAPRDVFEFCHSFIDFSDFLAVTGQLAVKALVSDLKVDEWYLQRFQEWANRVNDAASALQQ